MRALAIEPGRAGLHHNLEFALERMGQRGAAIASFERAALPPGAGGRPRPPPRLPERPGAAMF